MEDLRLSSLVLEGASKQYANFHREQNPELFNSNEDIEKNDKLLSETLKRGTDDDNDCNGHE